MYWMILAHDLVLSALGSIRKLRPMRLSGLKPVSLASDSIGTEPDMFFLVIVRAIGLGIRGYWFTVDVERGHSIFLAHEQNRTECVISFETLNVILCPYALGTLTANPRNLTRISLVTSTGIRCPCLCNPC